MQGHGWKPGYGRENLPFLFLKNNENKWSNIFFIQVF